MKDLAFRNWLNQIDEGIMQNMTSSGGRWLRKGIVGGILAAGLGGSALGSPSGESPGNQVNFGVTAAANPAVEQLNKQLLDEIMRSLPQVSNAHLSNVRYDPASKILSVFGKISNERERSEVAEHVKQILQNAHHMKLIPVAPRMIDTRGLKTVGVK